MRVASRVASPRVAAASASSSAAASRGCAAAAASRKFSRRNVTVAAKKRAPKFAPHVESDNLRYDPNASLADVLARKDAADAAAKSDWADSLAAFREEGVQG